MQIVNFKIMFYEAKLSPRNNMGTADANFALSVEHKLLHIIDLRAQSYQQKYSDLRFFRKSQKILSSPFVSERWEKLSSRYIS
jgi:hypothetical protein